MFCKNVGLTTKHIGWNAFNDGKLLPEKNHSWFDYNEIKKILLDLKIVITMANGFMPHENEIVPFENAHTFFIIGIKST